jgi:hypothetical protein
LNQFWTRILSAVVPSFGSDQHGQRLASTFTLLTNLLKILIILTAIWAIAAGFLQTGRLIRIIPTGFPDHGAGFWADRANWLAPLLGVPVYALKAFGVTMLIALAAATTGGFLGFLFGLPRLSGAAAAQTTPPTAPGSPASAPVTQAVGSPAVARMATAPTGAPSSPGTTAPVGARAWQASTNLTEISDWLTKIIVGVGLVEAKAIYEALSQLSGALGRLLFDGAAGSLLVLPAVIIAAAILGFLYAYLFTQLVIAELLARSDAQLSNAGMSLPEQGTILPADIQARKEAFSAYIQTLVDDNRKDVLDRIAQELGAPPEDDPRMLGKNILDAVGARVDATDAARAATQMSELSSQLHGITGQDF